jgi:hypothetical protein
MVDHRRLPAASGAGRLRFAAQEAFPAVYRPPLRRSEGHGGLTAALRASGHGFRLACTGRPGLPFALARFAALGLVLEVLVVEEVLFSRCENKFGSALGAFKNPILELRHNPNLVSSNGL